MHHSTHGNSDGHHWYADFIILCFLMTHFKDLPQAHTIVYLKKYNSKIPTFTPNLLNQNIESLSTIRRLQENKMFKKRPPLVASQYRSIGSENRSDMCHRWESNPAWTASTLSTRPGAPLTEIRYLVSLFIVHLGHFAHFTFICLSVCPSICLSRKK